MDATAPPGPERGATDDVERTAGHAAARTDASYPPATHDDLRALARAYARRVVRGADLPIDLDAVSWSVSARAKRRAGACRYDPETEAVEIRLAWRAARAFDWPTFAAVVRHELIHAWEYQRFGTAGHGPRFRERADPLDVSTTCPRFADPRLVLRCLDGECDWTAPRHRASATVTAPERRRCGSCGSRYVVEHVATGRTWLTGDGYRRARAAIGDGW